MQEGSSRGALISSLEVRPKVPLGCRGSRASGGRQSAQRSTAGFTTEVTEHTEEFLFEKTSL